MRSTRVLAACAALALTVAACGDDDDDAGADTSTATIAAGGGATTTAAGAATTAAAAPTTAAGAAGDEDIAADCAALAEGVTAQFQDAPADPEVGDEIPSEYKDFVEGALNSLEDLDLQSDEVQSAVDELRSFAQSVLDSDTWSDDLQSQSQTAFQPLLDVCAPYLGAGG